MRETDPAPDPGFNLMLQCRNCLSFDVRKTDAGRGLVRLVCGWCGQCTDTGNHILAPRPGPDIQDKQT